MTQTENTTQSVEEAFAAPEFRNKQKPVIEEAVSSLRGDYDVVLVDAPTGFGKSLVLESIAQMMGPSYYTTPLNSLVDQLEADEFLNGRFTTIKGRNNYSCVHPEDDGNAVDTAICQRDDDFECDIKATECPYYSRIVRAKEENVVVTNMSYLMATGSIPESQFVLGDRNTIVVDECQSIEDFAMNFVGVTISPRTVPDDVWADIRMPQVDDEETPIDEMLNWLTEHVQDIVRAKLQFYDQQVLLDGQQTKEEEELRQFDQKINRLVADIEENEWVYQIDNVIRKNKDNYKKVIFKPVYVGRFLEGLLWNQAENLVLSSATIPGGGWLEEIGLGDRKVRHISVGHEFPVDNRPIVFDECVGKMTYKERKKTAPKMADKIVDIASHYEGEKGLVHCRSYGIAEMLERAMNNNGHRDYVRDNVMVQDKYNREESLDNWLDSDKQLFLSVAMDEGIDLDGDKCRFQILAKVLYESMADERTSYRVSELNDWDWYNMKAAVQIQQAYGRAVRSEDDWAHFYILDKSAKGLIRRDAELFQEWFLEAIEDLRVDPSRGM
jgi:Rad3-related DNA helicase